MPLYAMRLTIFQIESSLWTKARKKDYLRNKRDRLMELNDAIMDAVLDIIRKYEDEAKKDEG